MTGNPPVTMRPYQLLCAVCSLCETDFKIARERSGWILEMIRKNPEMPITLCCNVGEIFAFQDPGAGQDTPEGAEFNLRRDLEILHKLNLMPGCTLSARILFNRVIDMIDQVTDICGYASVTSSDWKGCPKSSSWDYARGREQGIRALIPPPDEAHLKREKANSLDAMAKAPAINIRPHILMCAICQYGNGKRPPFPEDNLPELIALILKDSNIVLTLVPHADWMMCAPCPYRAPHINGCVNQKGSGGLPNQRRDLRLLQKLGLTYGSTLKARELYKLIFERVSGTLEICRLDPSSPSVWWDGCGSVDTDSESYDKGRKLLMSEMGLDLGARVQIISTGVSPCCLKTD